MYYNTTRLTGEKLAQALHSAENQEQFILAIFHKLRSASPFSVDVECRAYGKYWPITSVRRSITNLTNAGKLDKTTRTVLGEYGRPEYVWEIK